jgi:hypothetical protein
MRIRYVRGSHMEIDGTRYRRDLKIVGGEVKGDWWRKEGHRLDPEDMKDVLSANPDVLVVGTGYAENMAVPEATRSALSQRRIRVVARATQDAVEEFNRLASEGRDVAGAFHLTC